MSYFNIIITVVIALIIIALILFFIKKKSKKQVSLTATKSKFSLASLFNIRLSMTSFLPI